MSKLMNVLMLWKDRVEHLMLWKKLRTGIIVAGRADDFTQFYFTFMFRCLSEENLSLPYHPKSLQKMHRTYVNISWAPSSL